MLYLYKRVQTIRYRFSIRYYTTTGLYTLGCIGLLSFCAVTHGHNTAIFLLDNLELCHDPVEYKIIVLFILSSIRLTSSLYRIMDGDEIILLLMRGPFYYIFGGPCGPPCELQPKSGVNRNCGV